MSCVGDFFFFNDTATTEIYTLSLHDALPISGIIRSRRLIGSPRPRGGGRGRVPTVTIGLQSGRLSGPSRRGRSDRKSTRLNSSHANISYAVFCLKKKKNRTNLFV